MSQRPDKDQQSGGDGGRPRQRGEDAGAGGKKGGQGAKPRSGGKGEQQQQREGEKGQQDQRGASKPPPPPENPKGPVPELSPDEWIKIFSLLLKHFKGRTKLGTLLSQKGDLFKGFSHEDAAEWLKRSSRFLTFEKNGQVKFVSVNNKEARTCFKYRKHNTDRCENDECPFFHICKDFVAGSCPWDSSCHFNHSFHSKGNAKVCALAGLQTFTDRDIRTIVFRSTPVVCNAFNKGGCQDDCPDLHVCSKYVRSDCSDGDCKFGHKIKGPEHNLWILETFHMQKIAENTLCKMVFVLMPEGAKADGEHPGPESSSGSADRVARNKKPQDKAPGRRQSRSRERVLDSPAMTLPTTAPQQETGDTASSRRRQKQKTKAAQKHDESNDPEVEVLPSTRPPQEDLAARGFIFPQQETEEPGRGGEQSGRGGGQSGRSSKQNQLSRAAAREAETADVLRGAEGKLCEPFFFYVGGHRGVVSQRFPLSKPGIGQDIFCFACWLPADRAFYLPGFCLPDSFSFIFCVVFLFSPSP